MRRRARFVQNLDVRRRSNSPDTINKLERILLRPEVNVKRVKFVVVLVLILRIIRWEVPIVLVRGSFRSGQSDGAVLLVRISDVCLVEIYALFRQ